MSIDRPIYAVVLAGGSGTRLWPLSRSLFPKQLLALNGHESLLQQTVRRLLKNVPANRIITVTHDDHRFEVRDQLHRVDSRLTENLLAEPEGRNTLPAIAWAVANIARREPDSLIGVFPSDHVVTKGDDFSSVFQEATVIAAEGYIVTLGIPPTGPVTGYGYIRAGKSHNDNGAYHIASYTEKPDRDTALSYLKEGNYYWNAGMFIFGATTFQEELERFQPEIHEAFKKLVNEQCPQVDESKLREQYKTLPNISIDYGLMEKATNGVVIPADIGWNDVGSWDALYGLTEKDAHQNVTKGDVVSIDTNASFLMAEKGTIAAIGLENVVVVKTDDAVLVSSRDRVHEVKEIVNQLKEVKSDLVTSHSTVKRPWGSYTVLEEGLGYKIKRVVVEPGQKLSLQMHEHRAEHWVVLEGVAKVVNGEQELLGVIGIVPIRITIGR